MSKYETIEIRLTGRTHHQIKAAERFIRKSVLVRTGNTTIDLKGTAPGIAREVDSAVAIAAASSRGEGTAMHSVKRAVAAAIDRHDASADNVVLSATAKAAATRAAKRAAAKAPAEAPAKKSTPVKAAAAKSAPAAEAEPKRTNSRGVILDRVGEVIETGRGAGYEVRLAFAEFETAKRPGDLSTGPAWVTICVKHGTVEDADNAVAAERQGARKARSAWCSECERPAGVTATAAKQAVKAAKATPASKPVEATTGDGVPVGKAVAKAVAAAKTAAKKSTPAKAAKTAAAKKPAAAKSPARKTAKAAK